MNPSEKRKVRELTFVLLYQDYYHCKNAPLLEALRLFEGEKQNEKREEGATRLRERIKKREGELEELINCYSKWRRERIDLVDVAILKLALYEMLYEPQVPPAVAIDEAIELAKRYSSNKAYKFINGLLDRVMKERIKKVETPQNSNCG